jgi:DNA polymerase-1
VCVAGDGPRDAKIVVIGEAPGAAEERTGKPFQGKSGKVLRDELARHGILDECYITNVVKCRPPGNRTPTAEEIRACRPYLDKELAKIDPDYVLTVGVPATKVLFRGKAKINQFHGELIDNPKVRYRGMPTFHPAYTLRDPSKLPGFKNDIKRLAGEVKGTRETDEFKWSIVRRGNLDKFLEEFYQAREFAFDLETSGLFSHGGDRYITAIGIALPTRAWVIPGFMHPDFAQYGVGPWRRGQALKKLVELLVYIQRKTKKKGYGWNAKFDNLWLRNMFGVSFYLDFDGMLASHTLDENTANDLTTNCRDFLDVEEYDIPLRNKQGKTDDPMPNLKYCAQDCGYTLQLVKIFQKEFKKEKTLHRLFHKLVMPAARAMEDIEMEGLTLDLEAMEDIGLDLLSEKVLIEQRLNELMGYKVNWNAPAQIAKALYEDLGLPCTHYTAKKKPSTSEVALLDLMGKHEVVDLLFKYRERAKFISTYINGFKQYMVGDKLYVSYKLHGTVTGRYSSRIHSIPRDGTIRNLVTAPAGWKFVQGDISQAELRIAAAASGDLELRRCFTEDIDVHWRTLMHTLTSGGVGEYVRHLRETAATITLGTPGEGRTLTVDADILMDVGHEACIEIWDGWKEGRKKAKAINFGFIYGMYEKKFMETAKVKYGWDATYEEAHQAREAYFSLYSQLEAWHSKQKKLAKLNGFVRNLAGRLRRLPGITASDKMVRMEAERQSVNAPIQGFIGDYKAMAMVEIHEDVDRSKFRLVGEHHDAILGIVKIGHEDEVLPQVLSILRQPKLLKTFNIDLGLPMEGELEVGPWGKGEKYVYNAEQAA